MTVRLLTWSEERFRQWAAAPRMATKPIPGTRFLVLKVPLSSSYEGRYGGQLKQFDVDMFANRLIADRVRVGLVLDLTCEHPDTYFHNKTAWEDWDMQLVRLASHGTPTGDAPPTPGFVDAFLALVHSYLERSATDCIAVFDELGFNRAGVLVVSYMVQMKSMPLGEALLRYASARKGGVYSPAAMQFLKDRYLGDALPESIPAGVKPTWDKRTPEQVATWGVVVEAARQDTTRLELPPASAPDKAPSAAGAGAGVETKKRSRPQPPTFDGQPSGKRVQTSGLGLPSLPELPSSGEPSALGFGWAVPDATPLAAWARRACHASVGAAEPYTGLVSMAADGLSPASLPSLQSCLVTWRPTGHRCLVVGVKGGVLFVEQTPGAPVTFVALALPSGTSVVDAMVVVDRLPDGNQNRVLAFDALCVGGVRVDAKPLQSRLGYVAKLVKSWRAVIDKTPGLPFRLRAKDFYKPGRAQWLLSKFKPPHDTDGMVFAPVGGHYVSRVSPGGSGCLSWRASEPGVPPAELPS